MVLSGKYCETCKGRCIVNKILTIIALLSIVIIVSAILLSGWVFPVYWYPVDFIIGSTGGYYDDSIYLHLPTFEKSYRFYTVEDWEKMDCNTIKKIYLDYMFPTDSVTPWETVQQMVIDKCHIKEGYMIQ